MTCCRPSSERIDSPLLELDHVTKRFGRVVIAEDLSFSVNAGNTVGIVGPNGAGKTSLFGLISGDLSTDAGHVKFAGRGHDPARTRRPVQARHRADLPGPRPFAGMTVFENVLVRAARRRTATQGQLRGRGERAGAHRTGQGCQRARRSGSGCWSASGWRWLGRWGSGRRLLLLDEVAGGLTDPEVDGASRDRPRHQRRGDRGDLDRACGARADRARWRRLPACTAASSSAMAQPAEVLADPQVREMYLGSRGHRRGGRGRPQARPGDCHDRREQRRDTPADRPAGSGAPLLEVRDLTVHHGQLRACQGSRWRC